MSKKSKQNIQVFAENERALRELTGFKHRDLQRACIVRGLEPTLIADYDHHKLVSWFINNYENAQDEKLLLDYDLWVEEHLQERGYKKGDIMLAPSLRYSYVKDIENAPKLINPKPFTVPKVESSGKTKSFMDEKTGVRTGTKKSLTYKLTLEGLTIDSIIKQVKESFPEAQEKSIKIWSKKASKLNK